jgi:hypothetical protein
MLFETHLTPLNLPADASPITTLQDIVCSTAIISRESRIILAVLVAYSVLYLCGSPWLPPGWDKAYIHFLKMKNEVKLLWRPLLSGQLSARIHKIQNIPSGEVHRNLDRLQLGVILLEIFLRKPIEQCREEEDIGYQGVITTDTNFYTASQIYDDCDWDVPKNYKAAVAACLACDITTDQAPLDDPAYGSYIYDEIIKPLEAELAAFCNIAIDKLDEFITTAFRATSS